MRKYPRYCNEAASQDCAYMQTDGADTILDAYILFVMYDLFVSHYVSTRYESKIEDSA